MSVELITAANIKYINIKMKKKLKNNSDIIYIIKDACETYVKILLFLLCCENPEKIDFEFMKNSVKPETADDGEILNAVDFWKEKNILDYEITPASNAKGANMDNIMNIILNINRDMNIINGNGNEEGESGEYAEGLGIYRQKHAKSVKQPEISPEPVVSAVPVPVLVPVIKPEEPPKPVSAEASPVSIDELCEALETKEEFQKLIHETQIKMKTTFNTADLEIIYNLCETNNIEAGLILKFAETCAEEEKNNIRYLEKVALGSAATGIVTLKQYEEKIRETYKLIEFEDKIKKLFNAGDKKFSSKEKSYIKKWAKEFDFSDDVLTEGYKRCIKYSEKLSIDYINKIYLNWHEKGFRTLDDINAEFGANAESLNINANKKNLGFDVDRFFEKAIKKSMKI